MSTTTLVGNSKGFNGLLCRIRRGRRGGGLAGQFREVVLDRLKRLNWPAELPALRGIAE